MLKYVYGTKDRIFVNTEIGCRASCKYCYMASILEVNTIQRVEASKVIEEVKHIERIGGDVPGRENTIVSLEMDLESSLSGIRSFIRNIREIDGHLRLVPKKFNGKYV